MKENNILKTIIHVVELTKHKKLKIFTMPAVKKSVKPIEQKLHCTASEAILFCIIFSKYFNDNNSSVEVHEIARHLDCEPLEILLYEIHLRGLINKNILSLLNGEKRSKRTQYSYYFKDKIVQHILSENNDIVEHSPQDNIGLLMQINEQMQRYFDTDCTYDEMEDRINELIHNNMHLYFAERIKWLGLNNDIKLLLLYIITKTYKGEKEISMCDALDNLFPKNHRYYNDVKKVMLRNDSILFKQKIIKTIKENSWRNDIDIELTSEGAGFLFKEDANLILISATKKKEHNIVLHENILQKELLYNQADLATIDFIHNTLKEENYNTIIQRLTETNMSKGISILLHGHAGTGKTETVYQIAKTTERNIYTVDISELKSCWFGESQKLIKNIFSNYYKFTETEERTPILLFNEADGIINKRKDSSSSNVAQTENEIQNILLQEMEDFKGILMATTNLINNIDKAFDRRFLFKLELSRPSTQIRKQLLHKNIHYLSEDTCGNLAQRYEFTGGELQNILRKANMYYVLHNTQPEADWFDTQFNEECLRKSSASTIGFKR